MHLHKGKGHLPHYHGSAKAGDPRPGQLEVIATRPEPGLDSAAGGAVLSLSPCSWWGGTGAERRARLSATP